MNTHEYAQWFRGSTPYISAHRGKTFVVLLPGEAIAHANLANIIHDIALLHVLGVRLILVCGARPQIERTIGPDAQRYHAGLRITDAGTMELIAGINGGIRTQLEALFSTGLPNTPLHNVNIPVISGNFVIAQPIGIVDGIDFGFTGNVRRIEKSRVTATLDAGALLLQSSIGYSKSGQAFNISAESLATEMATQTNADKLIVFAERHLTDDRNERISTFTPATLDARADAEEDLTSTLQALSRAVRSGVSKAHLISYQQDGALLGELFTAAGVGTQVIEQQHEPVRRATLHDINAIVEVIRPLEEQGILVRRDRDRLEQEIEHFLVAEIDGIVVGCCAVYTERTHAELACVAVHENYRKPAGNGIGSALLEAAESTARQQGANTLFVLTTQTADWFREQGFNDARIDDLPTEKKALYNWQRNSRVMTRSLD